MPRTARKRSSTDIYHAIARGVSKQLIFEDDIDRNRFLKLLADSAARHQISILAWCLMGNHVHLLLKGTREDLSQTMKDLLASYANWFNLRHGRCGHLFQGRFKSETIESESHFLAVVRYIHKNPEAAGLADAKDWKWSSYGEYTGGPFITDTDFALELLGDKTGFHAFHERGDDGGSALDVKEPLIRMADEEALALADRLLGKGSAQRLKELDRETRDTGLRELKSNGLGIRQIQRLTGISLGVISKA